MTVIYEINNEMCIVFLFLSQSFFSVDKNVKKVF